MNSSSSIYWEEDEEEEVKEEQRTERTESKNYVQRERLREKIEKAKINI